MREPGCQGFTLIETIVVVALIAVSFSFLVVNLDTNSDSMARMEARRFFQLLEHARETSDLTGMPIAVDVDLREHKYVFSRLESDAGGSRWRVLKHDSVFAPRDFPENLSVSFQLLTDSPDSHGLLIDGIMEVTPFLLEIEGHSKRYSVTVDDKLSLKMTVDERVH